MYQYLVQSLSSFRRASINGRLDDERTKRIKSVFPTSGRFQPRVLHRRKKACKFSEIGRVRIRREAKVPMPDVPERLQSQEQSLLSRQVRVWPNATIQLPLLYLQNETRVQRSRPRP